MKNENIKKGRGGHNLKSFTVEANQKLWDQYLALKLEEGRPQTSINQYKPALVVLDAELGKSFAEVTVAEIEAFMEARQGKNKNHLTGFLVTCIGNDWLTANAEMILYLIPVEYKAMVGKLFK